ncbi:hypothetical protein LY78DRAFT_650041 [Colletotrichum sublineola]|nr:hypothetical protein LY78DRAFT_650041 [Colletotrichum sublineola]
MPTSVLASQPKVPQDTAPSKASKAPVHPSTSGSILPSATSLSQPTQKTDRHTGSHGSPTTRLVVQRVAVFTTPSPNHGCLPPPVLVTSELQNPDFWAKRRLIDGGASSHLPSTRPISRRLTSPERARLG